MGSRLRGIAAALAAAALTLLAVPAGASAQQIATIQAGFHPYRLGAHTAVRLGFHIRTADGTLPSALTGLTFHYPRQLGLAANGLGLASCNRARLQFAGPKACPPDSIMGYGSALAQFQVSPIISEEKASIAIVAGPPQHGYVQMLVAASGVYPVDARIVMPSLLLPGRLQLAVPLVPGVPEGPDVAVVKVKVTLGGRLTYYKRRHGRRVAYRPQGILLPRRCPRGGFRFEATFSFLDGTQAEARTVVKCPLHRSGKAHGGRKRRRAHAGRRHRGRAGRRRRGRTGRARRGRHTMPGRRHRRR